MRLSQQIVMAHSRIEKRDLVVRRFAASIGLKTWKFQQFFTQLS